MDTHRGKEECSLTKTRSKRKSESSDDSRAQSKKRKQNQDDFDKITIAQDDIVTKTTHRGTRGRGRASGVKTSSNVSQSGKETRGRGRSVSKELCDGDKAPQRGKNNTRGIGKPGRGKGPYVKCVEKDKRRREMRIEATAML